jgi:hypothetical protein
LKIPTAKRPGGVAQGLGPEFKTPVPQKKKKEIYSRLREKI